MNGDPRGTVDRRLNQLGDPIVGADAAWQFMERQVLRFPARELSLSQRELIERHVPTVCQRGGWALHATAAQKDHVHALVTASADGDVIRRLLKRWLGQLLSEFIPLEPEQTFWAECGSVKWVWDEDYFKRIKNYVCNQRATK